VVADADKRKIQKVMKEFVVKRRVYKLKDCDMRKIFEGLRD